jgi:hypothetical protein
VILSTFSAYTAVFMLLDVDLNGGAGGAGGQKGNKGMGGKGGEPGLPRRIGTTYETRGHTREVTIRGGDGKGWSIPSTTFTVVDSIECIPHDLTQHGHKGKNGRPGRENMDVKGRGRGAQVHIMCARVSERERERKRERKKKRDRDRKQFNIIL